MIDDDFDEAMTLDEMRRKKAIRENVAADDELETIVALVDENLETCNGVLGSFTTLSDLVAHLAPELNKQLDALRSAGHLRCIEVELPTLGTAIEVYLPGWVSEDRFEIYAPPIGTEIGRDGNLVRPPKKP